jgi:hypothetical protein
VKKEPRYIYIGLHRCLGGGFQCIRNDAGNVELEDGSIPETTKDSAGHGYGLTCIKTTLEAMDGVLHLRTDKDVFHLEATAKIK